MSTTKNPSGKNAKNINRKGEQIPKERSSTRAGGARGTIISSMTWELWAGGVKQTKENQPEEENLTQCVI